MTTRGIFILENIRSRQREGDWVPLGDVWISPPAADNAYMGGGTSTGSTSAMHKLTYATDGVSRIPSANLILKYGDNTAPVSSTSAGYFVGGRSGTVSNPNDYQRQSYVKKLTYATETFSLTNSVINSDSGPGHGPIGQGGASSATAGYTAAGSRTSGGGRTSMAQKIDFSSESWSALPNLVNTTGGGVEWQGDAIGNLDGGYWCGGSGGHEYMSRVYKITYSSDTTSSSPSSDLPVTGRYFAGSGNANHGFLMGRKGGPSSVHSTVIKFTYATDTASAHPSNLPVNVQQSRGTGSLSDGYASGGTDNVPGSSYLSSIQKIQYSTGTTSTITDSMTRGGQRDVLTVSARDHGATGLAPVEKYENGASAGDNVVTFDGNDAMCTNGDGSLNIGSNDFTVEAFVKYNQQDSNFRIFFDQRYGYSSTGNCIALFKASNNKIRAWHYPSNGTSIMESTSEVQADTWHHIAWTRTGGTNRLFFDGKLEDSTTTMGTTYLDGNTVELGGSYEQSNYYMLGQVSNERLTVGQALYTADFTVPTEPLTTTSQGALEGNVKFLGCNQDTVQGVTVGANNGWRSNQGDPTAEKSTTIPINQPPAPTPTPGKSPGPAFNGAIWMGGYDNDGGSTLSSGGKISFVDDTVTALPSTQLTGSRYNLAATSSSTAGYYGQAQTTQVVKVDYATDSPSTMPGGISGGPANSGNDARRRGASFGLATAGYFMNGSTASSGNLSNLDKITYSTEVIARLPGSNTPGGGVYAASGTSNQTAGYKTGGTSPLNKFPFSTESWGSIPSFGVTMWDAKTFANTTYGYWMGAHGNTDGSMTYKLTFASDTNSRLPSSDVPQRVRYGWGSGNSTHGYISGGNDNTPYRTSNIYKLSYSNDTWSGALPNTLQPNSRQNAAAGARQNGNGDIAPNNTPNTL